MKVILLEELKNRGGEGDVIEVATGYASNFLFPKKIAIPATRGNLKQLELRKHNIAKRESERLDSADKLLAALEGTRIVIPARVGEEGQLFGSVTALMVAEAINEQLGIEIDRKRIDMHGTIKSIGEHPVVVSIYRELKATVNILVVDEKKGVEEVAEAEEAEGEAEAVEAEAEAAIEAEPVAEIEAGEATVDEAEVGAAAADEGVEV